MFSNSAFAETALVCRKVGDPLSPWLNKLTKKTRTALNACIRSNSFCVLGNNNVLQSSNKTDQLVRDNVSVRLMIAQVSENDSGVCLIGEPGEGSSGLWYLAGWRVTGNKVEELDSMDLALNGSTQKIVSDYVAAYKNSAAASAVDILNSGYWFSISYSSKIGGSERHDELWSKLSKDKALKNYKKYCAFIPQEPNPKIRILRSCKWSSDILVGPFESLKSMTNIRRPFSEFPFLQSLYKCTDRCELVQ